MAFQLTELFIQFKADTKAFDKALDGLKSKLERMKTSFDGLESFAKKGFLTIAGLAVVVAKAYGDAEDADAKLKAAIRTAVPDATKEAINARADALGELAEKISTVTVYDDEQIKKAETLAYHLGVENENIEAVITTATGLASLFGGDLSASTEAASRAVQGNFRELERMLPALKNLGSTEQKWQFIQNKSRELLREQTETSNTLFNSLKRLWNQIGQLAQVFGKILVPYIEKAVRVFQVLVIYFKTISPETAKQIVKWTALTAAILGLILVVPRVIGAFAGIFKIFSGVSSLISFSVSAFKLFGPVLALLGNPLTLVAGLLAAITTFAIFSGKFKTIFTTIKDEAKGLGPILVNSLGNIGSGLAISIRNAFDLLAAKFPILNKIRDILSPIISDVFAKIAEIFNFIVDTSGTLFSSLEPTFSSIGTLAEQIVNFFSTGLIVSIKDFGSTFNTISKTMFSSWESFVSGIGVLAIKIATYLYKFMGDIAYGLNRLFLIILEKVAEGIISILTFLTSKIVEIQQFVSKMLDDIRGTTAGVYAGNEREQEVRKTVTEGDTLSKSQINKLSLLLSNSNDNNREIDKTKQELIFKFGNRALSQQDINVLAGNARYRAEQDASRTNQPTSNDDYFRKFQDNIKNIGEEWKINIRARLQNDAVIALDDFMQSYKTIFTDFGNRVQNFYLSKYQTDNTKPSDEELKLELSSLSTGNLSNAIIADETIKAATDAINKQSTTSKTKENKEESTGIAGKIKEQFDKVNKMFQDINRKVTNDENKVTKDLLKPQNIRKQFSLSDSDIKTSTISDYAQSNIEKQITGALLINRQKQDKEALQKKMVDLQKEGVNVAKETLKVLGKIATQQLTGIPAILG